MASGVFELQLPTIAMVGLTVGVGSDIANEVPDKLSKHGVKLFTVPGSDLPYDEINNLENLRQDDLCEFQIGWLSSTNFSGRLTIVRSIY
ncbi:MAG: hypothetical protein BWK72_19175 [Rhodoferax ferrireducens]|uniref:Uncharacterized protein n=1 Tax=Rhodoferax ferrireducens TaxID=192843 RepID=A0A1W9KPH2_9BURK|nr:MAG: hypothetical protein BWK72_19175 [Rhodoferax ferrireducens]